MEMSFMPISVPPQIVAIFWQKVTGNNCLNARCLPTGTLTVYKASSFSNSPSQDPVDAAQTEEH